MQTIFHIDTFRDAPLFFRIPATRSLVTLATVTPGIPAPEAPLVTRLAMDLVTPRTPDTTTTPAQGHQAAPHQALELPHIIQVVTSATTVIWPLETSLSALSQLQLLSKFLLRHKFDKFNESFVSL